MKAMNINPVCKKAISKFIDTYLVFFQMPTGMVVNPEQQQIWRKA